MGEERPWAQEPRPWAVSARPDLTSCTGVRGRYWRRPAVSSSLFRGCLLGLESHGACCAGSWGSGKPFRGERRQVHGRGLVENEGLYDLGSDQRQADARSLVARGVVDAADGSGPRR